MTLHLTSIEYAEPAEREAQRIREAAPELLAALQQLLTAVVYGRGWQDTDPACAAARAAIDKATDDRSEA